MKLLSHITLILLVALTISQPLSAQPAKKPNIVYIMSDDHASAAIGAYGSWLGKAVKTPNLDRLAKQGMRFTNVVVTNSICVPSRAAILTGQYSHKNGVYTLADTLNPNRQHLAHLLRALGYQTALFGKWHLHSDPTGFDEWNILPGQGRYLDPILHRKDEKGKVHKGYSEDVITDLTIDWIKQRDKDKPFVAFCHFKAPHRPWDPAPRFADLYKDVTIPEHPTLLDDYKDRSKAAANATLKIGESMQPRDYGGQKPPAGLDRDGLRKWAYQVYMKRYLSCVAAVDENVGRLLDFLDKAGLSENTIVIYTSDQGFFLGEHGWFDKRFMYEPCLLMPFLARYPGRIPAGKTNDDMILNIDFAPTLLEYAGGKAPAEMQGRSFKAMLEGQARPADWRTSMYYRYWMHMGEHSVPAHYGVRTDRYTLIHYYGRALGMKGAAPQPTPPEWELFDRQKDPGQMVNVFAQPTYADTLTALKKELVRLRQELHDEK